MTTRCPRASRWALALVLGLPVIARTAAAQPQQADPYGPFPYGAGYYRAFADPYYRNPAMPNQGPAPALGPRGGSLDRFYEELYGGSPLEDTASGGRRPVGPGVPYYSADRQYDAMFNRIYRPNQKADERANLDELRRRRDDLFRKLQREPDPSRRAEISRDLEQMNRRLAQALTPNRSGAPRRPAAPARPGAAPAAPGRPRTTQELMTRAMSVDLPAPAAAPAAGETTPR